MTMGHLIPGRARRLKAIAKHINESWPEYEAKIVEGYCDTDRKIGRLRVPGKGRRGNRLLVRRRSDKRIVFDHNAAETYRSNDEVEYWVRRVESGAEVPEPRGSTAFWP
jgi:hypothetical protein